MTSSATKSFSARHFLISYAMSPFSQYSITMSSLFYSFKIILLRINVSIKAKTKEKRHLLVVVFHNIEMIQAVEGVDLTNKLLLLALLHAAIVKFFPT